MTIRTPKPIDLTEERIQVGDTIAFVEKMNRTQEKFENWTSQDWNNFAADVAAVAASIDQAGVVAQENAEAANLSKNAANAAANNSANSATAAAASATAANTSQNQAATSAANAANSATAAAASATAANTSKNQAATSATNAANSATAAAASATAANTSKNQAATSATNAANSASSAAAATFTKGTTMLFIQATAPVGWTKSTAHNDKALRIVSGNGGGSGGSATFSNAFNTARGVSVTVNNHTLTVGQMPSHTHQFETSPDGGSGGVDDASGGGRGWITTTSAGGGQAHNHSASGSLNLNVAYVDAIICTKD